MIGKTLEVLYRDAQQYRDVGARAWPIIEQGGTFMEDVPMRRRDGRDIWVRQVAHLLDVAKPRTGVILTMEDVSDRKALELTLKRSNVELEQFASVVSHDLRQPLSMARGYLSLIEKRLGSDLADDIKTYLHHAIVGTMHMDRLISAILDYSRTGSDLEFVMAPLGDAITVALRNLQAAVRDADADISVADNMPTIAGDPIELVRLFENLIGNALKYRAPGRLLQLEIGWRQQADDYLVWIADNGMGIAPADRDRAFIIFQRLVPEDFIEGSGIGLLAICKKIVEHHGGNISISPMPLRAASFFCRFR